MIEDRAPERSLPTCVPDLDFEFDPDTYLNENMVVLLRRRMVSAILGECRGLTILDAGCGDGSLSRPFLADNRVTFLDSSKRMLDEAAKAIPAEHASHAEFIHSRIRDIEGLFDRILCMGVLAYIADIEHFITSMARLLKPGGQCLIQLTDTETISGKLIYSYAARRGQLVARDCPRLTLTKLSRSQVLSCAASKGFILVREHRYPGALPGIQRLGTRIYTKYLEWGWRGNKGSELLILLARPER
jgi:2-polyprenyl-3-methyl-5-hydroxy-6-metoxy-1,4-benzoquinol methylase